MFAPEIWGRRPRGSAGDRVTLSAAELDHLGLAAAYALSDLQPDLHRSRTDAGPLVERLAARCAADWIRPLR